MWYYEGLCCLCSSSPPSTPLHCYPPRTYTSPPYHPRLLPSISSRSSCKFPCFFLHFILHVLCICFWFVLISSLYFLLLLQSKEPTFSLQKRRHNPALSTGMHLYHISFLWCSIWKYTLQSVYVPILLTLGMYPKFVGQ